MTRHHHFEIGDRVQVNELYPHDEEVGLRGTVITMHGTGLLTVVFDPDTRLEFDQGERLMYHSYLDRLNVLDRMAEL